MADNNLAVDVEIDVDVNAEIDGTVLIRGPRGFSITKVEKIAGTHAAGTLDTYRVYIESGETDDFYVYNGKDAYTYAVNAGYEGTEAEFAELMGHFAEYYETAKAAANEILQIAPHIYAAAGNASNSAQDAARSKTAAANSAAEANSAANSASYYAQNATNAARSAQTYSNGAGVSASAAESAKNAALDAKEAAAQSASSAATSERNASLSETAAAESERQAGLSKDAAAQSAQNAGQSEFAAQGYAEDAEAAATDIQESVDGVAQEPTAQEMLGLLGEIKTLLDIIAEQGGSAGNLNGFSLSRNADGSVTLGYTNPDDETDTDSIVFPTDSTAEEIANAFDSIADSLAIIAGQN